MRTLLVPLLSGVLLAQAPAPVDPDFKIGTTVRIVMAPVTVTDKSGAVVNGLTPADFQLTDNGKLQRITEDVTTHPLSVVVAIQANGVVEKILPQIRKIGSVLQAQVIGDEGELAVVSFDHRIMKLSDFTSDGDKISMALGKLKPGSATSRLNDAAIESITMLKSRPASRRRVLLLISESRDNGSEIRAREVMTAAEFANVVIYSVDISHLIAAVTATPTPSRPNLIPPGGKHLPGGAIDTPTVQSQNDLGNWVPVIKEIYTATKAIFVPNPLEVYTNYSGGREYSFTSQKTLDRAISDLGEELHSQYLLTYSPNNQDEAGFHNIVVRVLKPELKVRTRDGYYIAGQPPQ